MELYQISIEGGHERGRDEGEKFNFDAFRFFKTFPDASVWATEKATQLGGCVTAVELVTES